MNVKTNFLSIDQLKELFINEESRYFSYKLEIGKHIQWHDFLIKLDPIKNLFFVNLPNNEVVSIDIMEGDSLETNMVVLSEEILKYVKENYTLVAH